MNPIRLRRFLVENPWVREGICRIEGSEAHHMSRVLRMASGDRFVLLNGKGDRFLAEILSTSRETVTVKIKKNLPGAPPPPLEITLCQAIIKSASMDVLIQKASELGVARILPFTSSRTVVRLKGDPLTKKHNRWREIARNAAKQCNRDTVCEILPLIAFETFLRDEAAFQGKKALLWEGETSSDLKGFLQSRGPVKKFTAMVGPEGGFSQEEVTGAQRAGFMPVSLGNRVLRSETAALSIAAIVQYEWGDLNMSREPVCQ